MAKARAVNGRLWMFNTKTNRERLGFNINALIIEHLKAVAGAVANGENNMPAMQGFTTAQSDTGNLTMAFSIQFAICFFISLAKNTFNLLLKAYFTTQTNNLGTHILNHGDQLKGADMGSALGKDFLWRTGDDKFF